GFARRCPHVEVGRCTSSSIPLEDVEGDPGHRVACARSRELAPWSRPRPVPVQSDGTRSEEPVISTHHLTKLYQARRGPFGTGRRLVRALDGVDVDAPRRQTLAIVGESGCGKSTLAKVCTGIEVATAGQVTLDGHEVADVPVAARGRELKRTL